MKFLCQLIVTDWTSMNFYIRRKMFSRFCLVSAFHAWPRYENRHGDWWSSSYL